MIAEAVRQFDLQPREAVEYLKKHPHAVRRLDEHLTIPSRVYQRGIEILPVTHVELHASRPIRARYGLMTNDSLIVAVMRRYQVINLATTDADFDRVGEITTWHPL